MIHNGAAWLQRLLVLCLTIAGIVKKIHQKHL